MISLTSRRPRAILNNALALTKNQPEPFLWYNGSAKNNHDAQIYFSSSRELHPSSKEKYLVQHRRGRNHDMNSIITKVPGNRLKAYELLGKDKIIRRSKSPRQTEPVKTMRSKQLPRQRKSSEHLSSLVQFSEYFYRIRDNVSSSDSSRSFPQSKTENRVSEGIMQSMNASALLDPLNFCKGSAKLPSDMKSGPRSICGNDAARRLLRGKKDFLLAARKLHNKPVLLDGHGVPPALFQHCIDMADALLRHYGPDVVECSFQNHCGDKLIRKAPSHVRVRSQGATNLCMPLPSVITRGDPTSKNYGNNVKIDWDYNLSLYLTVMERLAKSLGRVFELSSFKNDKGQNQVIEKNLRSACVQNGKNNPRNDNDDDDEFDLSSLLSPPSQPLWNVDILRGAYFDLKPIGGVVGSKIDHFTGSKQPKNGTERNHDIYNGCVDGVSKKEKIGRKADSDFNCICPSPVVEFVTHQNSRLSGHVLIRLQGYPVANNEFDVIGSHYSQQLQQQPVTMVFDACIHRPAVLNNEVNL